MQITVVFDNFNSPLISGKHYILSISFVAFFKIIMQFFCNDCACLMINFLKLVALHGEEDRQRLFAVTPCEILNCVVFFTTQLRMLSLLNHCSIFISFKLQLQLEATFPVYFPSSDKTLQYGLWHHWGNGKEYSRGKGRREGKIVPLITRILEKPSIKSVSKFIDKIQYNFKFFLY